MSGEGLDIGIRTGLEVSTLQNLCDASILLLFVALALVAGRGYLEEIRDQLSLREAGQQPQGLKPRGLQADSIRLRSLISSSPAIGRLTAAPLDPREPSLSRDASRRFALAPDAGRLTGPTISRGPTRYDPTWPRAGSAFKAGSPETETTRIRIGWTAC